MQQLDIFDLLCDKYKISKPIRIIEFFAGYGSQSKALERLKVPFEHYKIAEWAIPSILAYNEVHSKYLPNYGVDFSKDLTKEEIVDYLYDIGVSLNYNVPAKYDQIKRLKEDKLRNIYNAIHSSNNLVNVAKVKGEDLNIVEKDKYEYMLTYSFPCITNDSLILTTDGYIQMKDVIAGKTKVLTKSNTWQTVAKKFDNGVHQTCYLNAMGFENIHCTLNHKFYVREMYREWNNSKRRYDRKFKKPIFKETKDLTKKDYLGVPVINEEKSFFSDDLDFWYIVGMYLGDGWLPKKCNDVIISCNEKKLELLTKKLPFKWSKYQNGTCYNVRFNDKKIRKFLEQYIGTGSEKKRIPYEVLTLPKKQLNCLYQGYLDSDGCSINNTRQFTSINKNLIYSMSLIINKLFKMPTRIYKNKVSPKKEIQGRIVNQKDWYQLRFKTEVKNQDRAFYEDGYIWYPFHSIKMADKENVYNMEVENDHSYVIQGCISKNCQDLSLAGKQKGFAKGTSTRSGMLWEVERILNECKELGNLPNILLMENVPPVLTADPKSWREWCYVLEEMGYTNFCNVLNAKNYGIPQNRDRAFMVSILGKDIQYRFPIPFELKNKVKDLVEKNPDEKWYLSPQQVLQVLKWNAQQEPFETLGKDICPTLTTRSGAYAAGMVLTTDILTCEEEKELKDYILDTKKIMRMGSAFTDIQASMITPDGNVKRYLDSDIVDEFNEGQVADISFPNGYNKAKRTHDICPTINTTTSSTSFIYKEPIEDVIACEIRRDEGIRTFEGNVMGALRTISECGNKHLIELPNFRIRKLTPLEACRLMGLDDEDYEAMKKVLTDEQIWHCCGDSIVVDVLYYIFKELLNEEY